MAETTNDSAQKIGEGSIKYDAGKAPVQQGLFNYFPRALEAVAQVSGFGASKYAWGGWKTVDDGINRYSNALGRHQLKKQLEGSFDSDSKLLHDAHIAWNALAILELYLKEQENQRD